MRLVLPAALPLLLLLTRTQGEEISPEANWISGTVELQTPEPENVLVHWKLLTPRSIEKGKTYPLIVFLHGAGERGSDNEKQLKYLPTWMASPEWQEKYPCFLLAPQCPAGMKWMDSDWTKKNLPIVQKKEPTLPMQGAISALKSVLKTQPIDLRRVSLTGLSMGGYGSWDLATRHPEWFSAVAPICGAFDTTKLGVLKGLPIRMYHGGADRVIPVGRGHEIHKTLTELGIDHKYTEYEGVGHNSWTPAYQNSDLVPWLLEQKKSADCPTRFGTVRPAFPPCKFGTTVKSSRSSRRML